MQREINIRLNANRAKAVHTGHKFASGDKGIVFKIAVDELDTTGTTARIVFRRSNGTSVEAEVTVTDGICSYTTLGNEFAVVGLVTADVKFYEGEKRISTCTFVFDVASDTLDGIGAGTGGYSDTLERMKEEMEEILAQMKDVMDGAEEDVEAAEKKMADLTADLEALYQEYVDAFGGTGPFNPRGPYSETENYTVRDMVTYDDASWVCYRNCTGATPSKDSDCWQHFTAGTSESLQDIIDGTQPVGDAKKLDGHRAEDFATAENLEEVNGKKSLSTSIINKALEVTTGVYEFYLSGSSYTGNDLPYASASYGNATIIKRNVSTITIILWGINSHPYPTLNFYNGTSWTGWIDLFTTAGGTIDGNVTVSADRLFPIALKNTGNNVSYTRYEGKDGILGFLGFSASNTPTVLNNSGGTLGTLLHTGNKPTGTYTGNGTARDISVGGIGGIIAVRGNDHIMIVTGSGAFGCKLSNGAFVVENSNVSKFINGTLSLAENSVLNAQSLNFSYEVL